MRLTTSITNDTLDIVVINVSLSVKADDRNFVYRQLFKTCIIGFMFYSYCQQLRFVSDWSVDEDDATGWLATAVFSR